MDFKKRTNLFLGALLLTGGLFAQNVYVSTPNTSWCSLRRRVENWSTCIMAANSLTWICRTSKLWNRSIRLIQSMV